MNLLGQTHDFCKFGTNFPPFDLIFCPFGMKSSTLGGVFFSHFVRISRFPRFCVFMISSNGFWWIFQFEHMISAILGPTFLRLSWFFVSSVWNLLVLGGCPLAILSESSDFQGFAISWLKNDDSDGYRFHANRSKVSRISTPELIRAATEAELHDLSNETIKNRCSKSPTPQNIRKTSRKC